MSVLTVAVSLPVLLIGLLALRLHVPQSAGATTGPAQSTAAPLLILRPQVTHLMAVLGHGIVLRGTLEPTLPGLNTVRVVLHLPPGAAAATDQVDFAAAMLGMTMLPSRAVLRRGPAGAFTGRMRLPMFGQYHVAASLQMSLGRETGMFTLVLPFPHP